MRARGGRREASPGPSQGGEKEEEKKLRKLNAVKFNNVDPENGTGRFKKYKTCQRMKYLTTSNKKKYDNIK